MINVNIDLIPSHRMPRLTRQRLAVFATLARGPATFVAIMTALGIPPDYSRRDYARAHRIVMDLVRERVVSHQKNRRHHASTFTLTPRERVAEYRRELEMHFQLLDGSSIPAATATHANPLESPSTASTPLHQSQLDADAGVKCPECGESVSLDRARILVEAGSKVLCRCSNDLTSRARDALDRLEAE